MKLKLVLLVFISVILGCGYKNSNRILNYSQPIDSFFFNFTEEDLQINKESFTIGKNIKMLNDTSFIYYELKNPFGLHSFSSIENKHTYINFRNQLNVVASMINDSEISVLTDSFLYKFDLNFNIIDSFKYRKPIVDNVNGIDWSDDEANLFKIGNFYSVVYYRVTDEGEYRNTTKQFYLFNKDTAFFTGQECNCIQREYHYYRYPVVVTDENCLYYSPSLHNCISKISSNINSVPFHHSIKQSNTNYLKFDKEYIYSLSKHEKMRFTTDFNFKMLCDNKNIYLIKEFTREILVDKNKIQTYKKGLDIINLDKNLNFIRSSYIDLDSKLYYGRIKLHNNKLYFFNFEKNKCYVFKV